MILNRSPISSMSTSIVTDPTLLQSINGERKDPDSPWIKSQTAKASNKLFQSYAKHVSDMIKKNEENEKHLLNIIEQLFSFWVDPKTREKK